jgi:hypothetical protein
VRSIRAEPRPADAYYSMLLLYVREHLSHLSQIINPNETQEIRILKDLVTSWMLKKAYPFM